MIDEKEQHDDGRREEGRLFLLSIIVLPKEMMDEGNEYV